MPTPWELFHQMWSKAQDHPDYVKEEWKTIENFVPGPAQEPDEGSEDTKRLDWLEKTANGVGVVNDDGELWACISDGMQKVHVDPPQDIMTAHFVEAEQWKKSVREAIDHAIEEEAKEDE